jgi:hypothetical protein
MIRVTVTDGGRLQEGFTNEWNDCAVRALALSTNVSYTKAHGLLKAEGRRDRKGTKLPQIKRCLATLCNESAITNYQEIGSSAPYMSLARPAFPTLQETIRKYSTGRYLIIATGHALTLIDGVVHDKGQISGPRSRVRNIFKITLAESVKPAIQIKPKEGDWEIDLRQIKPYTVVGQMPQSQINELWARLDKLEGKL